MLGRSSSCKQYKHFHMNTGNEIKHIQNIHTNTPRGCHHHITTSDDAHQTATAYNSSKRRPTDLVLEEPSSIMVHSQEQVGDGRHRFVVEVGPLGLVCDRDIVPVPMATTKNGFMHSLHESVRVYACHYDGATPRERTSPCTSSSTSFSRRSGTKGRKIRQDRSRAHALRLIYV